MSEQNEPQDPFEGDSKSFEVTSEVDTAQLQKEISQRVGKQVQVALVIEFGKIASEANPGTLFVHPESVDGRSVRGVIESHTPRRSAPVAVPEAPSISDSADPEVQQAAAKLAEGKTLTTAEISAVLKAILGVAADQE